MQAPFGLFAVGSRVEVEHFALVSQRLKTVGKTFWNDEGTMVVPTQYLGMPMQECWRATAQIQGNIKNFATQAPDKFHLCMRWILEVHAAHSAALGSVSMVDLDDGFDPASGGQLFGTKQARQETATVPLALALYELETGQRKVDNVEAAHSSAS